MTKKVMTRNNDSAPLFIDQWIDEKEQFEIPAKIAFTNDAKGRIYIRWFDGKNHREIGMHLPDIMDLISREMMK
jgi:hypothetical protein